MKRPLIILLGLLGLVLVPCPPAPAQNPYYRPTVNPYAKPVFSPYLNLLRQGSSPAVNYYGIVRPEIEFSNSIQQLRQQDVQLQQNVSNLEEAATLPVTGHASQFLNHNRYFMNLGGQGMAAKPLTAAPTRPLTPAKSGKR